MKRLYAYLLILCISAGACYAQSWKEITSSALYIYGEGYGTTLEQADKEALAQLMSKISVATRESFQYNLTAQDTKSSSSVSKVIQTYSASTLKNTQSVVISARRKKAHVGRYLLRSDLEKLFQERRDRVDEHVALALRAMQRGKVDDALRNFYWAQMLLQTLQYPALERYTDPQGEKHTLVTWIPAVMDEILDDVSFSVSSLEGSDLQLKILYKGKNVTSIDYSYYDGTQWSSLYSATDGLGVLELAPGAEPGTLQVRIEYSYRQQAHIDAELYQVLEAQPERLIKGATKYFPSSPVAVEPVVAATALAGTGQVVQAQMDVTPAAKSLMQAIAVKDYESADSLFTPDGLQMYRSLIAYGNASLVGAPQLKAYSVDSKTVLRGIPMSFSFSRGVRKSFVENMVFTFNEQGKIDNIAFALDNEAARTILDKQQWPEQSRLQIVEFLENYKTAFALKRLDYIRTIFDDHAVIIVGKVVKQVQGPESEGLSYKDNTYVERTRYTKQQYLSSLERCFESNEFVNIRFSNNDVVKAGQGGELYGIQIKQDYYSTNYGDTGYLFLMVDLNDPEKPIIKVRTWQDQPDPQDGLFDLSCF